MKKIALFKGEYRFLSNFYPSPVSYQGLIDPNAEAAFQAQKCASKDGQNRLGKLLMEIRAERFGKPSALR